MSQDPEVTIQRATRGDAQAVSDLMERYLPELRAHVERRMGAMLRARESGSDLVQSVCREVLEHLDRFHYGGEEGFRRWLHASALRKLRARRRYWRADKRDALRQARSPEGSAGSLWLDQLCRALGSPSGSAIRKEDAAHLEQALRELPDSYREVIHRVYLEGISPGELARREGQSAGSVRVRLSRALARLALVLRDEAGPGPGNAGDPLRAD